MVRTGSGVGAAILIRLAISARGSATQATGGSRRDAHAAPAANRRSGLDRRAPRASHACDEIAARSNLQVPAPRLCRRRRDHRPAQPADVERTTTAP
jgi:hypothetical protein